LSFWNLRETLRDSGATDFHDGLVVAGLAQAALGNTGTLLAS
jgi:hypothetical protein